MTDEEFEEYFNSIVNSDEFKELDSFIKFSKQRGSTMLEKTKRCLVYQCNNGYMSFPGYREFHDFFEAYKKRKRVINYDEDGYIDLENSLYLKQPLGFAKNSGNFTVGYFLFSDGSTYLSKFPLYEADDFSNVSDENCIYNPIIATGIAKALGVDTSENTIAIKKDGKLRLFSKNFLKPNEELITFFEYKDHQKISEILSLLETNLALRKFPKDQIQKAKFDFLKQEFLAKLIGLCDQKGDNTTLIISMDEDRKKRVRLAPMYDYDFSFNVVKGNGFRKRCADNGKTDIVSFVEQYRDYPEFLDFVKTSVNILDMEKVYENIYNDTGIKIFESSKENPDLEDDYTEFLKERLKTDYTGFVNSNLRMIQKLLKSFEREKMGENIKSI